MDYLIAAVLGVVQGLTEFLPVSSTAHLLIAGRLFGYEDPVFTVVIQPGSVLAVMWLYRVKIVTVIAGLPSDRDAQQFTLMLLAAFIPAVLFGAFLGEYVQTVLYYSFGIIAISFVAGGIVMLLVERYRAEPDVVDAEKTPLSRALGIGMCQVLALVPGVSRSGATILGGMLMRLDRPAAAEFSFFLAMPTMAAAFVYEMLEFRRMAPERAVEIGSVFTGGQIALGFVMAFLSALVVVKPFLQFVRRAGFVPFAWYRIAIGSLLLAALGAGWP
ncbi:MAG: undecaprenyl-diphosphate phosphatase [Luteitalea sp.]|nr:undecaprenyl-diphosphate phosphatase [Luteitalea sp.]